MEATEKYGHVKGAAMKIEIEKDFPSYFKPAYPEEFELFSHLEVTAGIPTVLFAVTTWKGNGKPNVCFHFVVLLMKEITLR